MFNNESKINLSLIHLLTLIKAMISLTDTTTIYIVPDVHGDLNVFLYPLITFLNDSSQDKYLIYLGDYIDRGEYDAYIYCIIKSIQKMEGLNERVIFLRGNHEQIKTNPDLYTRWVRQNFQKYKYGRFTQNESFMWQLFHDECFKLYQVIECAFDKAVDNKFKIVCSHAPIYSSDLVSLRLSQNDELDYMNPKTKVFQPLPPTIENDILNLPLNENENEIHFTTIDNKQTKSVVTEVEYTTDSGEAKIRRNTEYYHDYSTHIGKNNTASIDNNPYNSNVANVYGHTHIPVGNSDQLLELLQAQMNKLKGGDNVYNFSGLDTDGSYGFPFKLTFWTKPLAICNTETYNNCESSVRYIIIRGSTIETKTEPKIKFGSTDNTNFNNVHSLHQLVERLTKVINPELLVINENILNVCVDRFKQMFQLKPDVEYPIQLAYKYIRNFVESNERFEQLLQITDPYVNTIGYPTMQYTIAQFNNVPYDILQACGIPTSDSTPFHIYCESINKVLKDEKLTKQLIAEAYNDYKHESPANENALYNKLRYCWMFHEQPNSKLRPEYYKKPTQQGKGLDGFLVKYGIFIIIGFILLIVIIVSLIIMVNYENKLSKTKNMIQSIEAARMADDYATMTGTDE